MYFDLFHELNDYIFIIETLFKVFITKLIKLFKYNQLINAQLYSDVN